MAKTAIRNSPEDKQFEFGDIVKILGYREQYLFKVQSMTYKQYHEEDEFERTYGCKKLSSNEKQYIAFPSEMLLIQSVNDVNSKNLKKTVDGLLDRYNDQMVLYELFKDKSYKRLADGIMCLLKQKYQEND